MNQRLPLVLHYKSKILEFPLPNTYKQLITHCSKFFDQFIGESIIFNYLDSEGDIVQISSDYDYNQALIYLHSTDEEVFILSVEEFNHDIMINESFQKRNEIVRHFYEMKIKEKALKVMKYNIKIGEHFILVLNKRIHSNQRLALNSIKTFSSFCLNKTKKNNSNSWSNDYNSSNKQIDFDTYIKNHIKSFINIESICNKIKQEILTSSLNCIHFSNHKPSSKETNVDQAIYSDIACSRCKISPIKGIQYKCSVCPDYNLCQDCEEDNYLNSIHPHNFFKMKQIENISYQCLNHQLSFSIPQGQLNKFIILILIKNTSLINWSKHSFIFTSDKLNSTIIADDTMSDVDHLISQELSYNITFNNIKHLQCGNYVSLMNLTKNNIVYGHPILVKVNIYTDNSDLKHSLHN